MSFCRQGEYEAAVHIYGALLEQRLQSEGGGIWRGTWRLMGFGSLGLGARVNKADISLTVEHIFSVARPDLVIRLLMGKGAGPSGVTSHHVEACVRQLVKGLLQKGEL